MEMTFVSGDLRVFLEGKLTIYTFKVIRLLIVTLFTGWIWMPLVKYPTSACNLQQLLQCYFSHIHGPSPCCLLNSLVLYMARFLRAYACSHTCQNLSKSLV